MKVRNLFCTNRFARTIAAATLVTALALSAGSVPAALADTVPATTPVTVQAPGVAAVSLAASLTASATLDATTAALVATPAVIVVAPAPRKLSVRQIIAKVGRDAGLRQSEIDGLLWIAKHESNFHPTSASRSGCYGLFQLSRGMAHGHPWKDPTWNTKRAIKYMKGRYGSVLKAKAFWMRHHWY